MWRVLDMRADMDAGRTAYFLKNERGEYGYDVMFTRGDRRGLMSGKMRGPFETIEDAVEAARLEGQRDGAKK